MHDERAMKMKHEMNGMILSMFLSDNNTNKRLNAIAVTEYIIDIQTQVLAFSDIRELKLFIRLWFLISFIRHLNSIQIVFKCCLPIANIHKMYDLYIF